MTSPTARPFEGRAHAPPSVSGRALVYGEMLFDHFPDGSRVLGGAPFNVAWHLRGLGCDPLMISAVGNDEEGEEILDRMRAWGLSTDAVAENPDVPTGSVEVGLEDGRPSYRIPPHQAWDRIPQPALRPGTPALLYHGTLALRERGALQRCLDLRDRFRGTPVFVDLNLRAPWWTPELVERCLSGSTWVKLSAEELADLTGSPAQTGGQCGATASRIMERHAIHRVLVTRGEQGALLFRGQEETLTVAARRVPDIVDTVGAGDAFAAVMCCSIVKGWADEVALDRAGAFALDVCRMRGATSPSRSLYEAHLRQWRDPPKRDRRGC